MLVRRILIALCLRVSAETLLTNSTKSWRFGGAFLLRKLPQVWHILLTNDAFETGQFVDKQVVPGTSPTTESLDPP